MDQIAATTFFKQITEQWITPELNRRRAAGTLPEGFLVERALVRLPKTSAPVVELNDEIGWFAEVELTKARQPHEQVLGAEIHVHDVKAVKQVSRPEMGGVPVAFIYVFHKTGTDYGVVFDFSPNSEEVADGLGWELGSFLASHLERRITEKVLCLPAADNQRLKTIGLWAVPVLLPFPLNVIVQHLQKNEEADARSALVSHCNSQFLEALVTPWDALPELKDRHTLVAQALAAHARGEYALAIYALMPQIEGIISEWLIRHLPAGEQVPFRQESKTKKLRDVLKVVGRGDHLRQHVVESTIDFLLGPVLQQFQNWNDPLDETFAGRHPIGHGKYEARILAEEHSVKLFLLIDTLVQALR